MFKRNESDTLRSLSLSLDIHQLDTQFPTRRFLLSLKQATWNGFWNRYDTLWLPVRASSRRFGMETRTER